MPDGQRHRPGIYSLLLLTGALPCLGRFLRRRWPSGQRVLDKGGRVRPAPSSLSRRFPYASLVVFGHSHIPLGGWCETSGLRGREVAAGRQRVGAGAVGFGRAGMAARRRWQRSWLAVHECPSVVLTWSLSSIRLRWNARRAWPAGRDWWRRRGGGNRRRLWLSRARGPATRRACGASAGPACVRLWVGWPVVGLPVRVGLPGPGAGQRLLVGTHADRAAAAGCGAACPQRAAGADHTEVGDAAAVAPRRIGAVCPAGQVTASAPRSTSKSP